MNKYKTIVKLQLRPNRDCLSLKLSGIEKNKSKHLLESAFQRLTFFKIISFAILDKRLLRNTECEHAWKKTDAADERAKAPPLSIRSWFVFKRPRLQFQLI